nr:LuxR family transcriptional regulator [Escherichia marmotae]
MKKSLMIISTCQFTRIALLSFIPKDRYIVRVYSNVTSEFETVLKTSCGYLLADIPSLHSGEQVLLACLLRLRTDAGQWQVSLTGDSDWFNNSPVSSLYKAFPYIDTILTVSNYKNQIMRWLLRPLPSDMSKFGLLTARELGVLKLLMQGISFSQAACYEKRSSQTLHSIARRALTKLEVRKLIDFKMLYSGCCEVRIKK